MRPAVPPSLPGIAEPLDGCPWPGLLSSAEEARPFYRQLLG